MNPRICSSSEHAGAESLEHPIVLRGCEEPEDVVKLVHGEYLRALRAGEVDRREAPGIKGKAVFKLGGIDICTDDVAIVADLCRLRGNCPWKLYVRECPILPHKAVRSVPLFSSQIVAHDHSLIIDAAGKGSACSARKGDDGELALMQEEADIRTVSGEYPHNISQIVHAIGRSGCIGKARKSYLVKNAVLDHEGASSVRAAKGADDHAIFVDVVREGVG